MDRVRMCAYGGGMKLSRCERQKHFGSNVQSFIGTQGPVAYGSSKACVRSGVVQSGSVQYLCENDIASMAWGA